MRVIVNGSNGRMGREVVRMIQEGYAGVEVVAGVDINNSAAEKFPIYENIEDFVFLHWKEVECRKRQFVQILYDRAVRSQYQ